MIAEPQPTRLQPVDDDVLSVVSSLMLDPPGQETCEKGEEYVQQLESQFSAKCTLGYVFSRRKIVLY